MHIYNMNEKFRIIYMIYVVKQGDSLYSIAENFGVPIEKILYDNQLYGQENLVIGQALLILEAGFDQPRISEMYVTGYAYTFINMDLLLQQLPYLNELLIFSYGFTEEGELVPPLMDDLPLIRESWKQNVKPILVLTPFGKDGSFNNYLVKIAVEDPKVQENLIQNLLFTVQDRGYAGVDVDFEYILPEDKFAYTEFVRHLREVLNPYGLTVSVALPPKTSAIQGGVLFAGIDFPLLGANADKVFLMTYEWGYTYGPPMAVAPLNKVREVLDYAVTEIPGEKILMGIPNYGYDWQLPFIKGTSAAKLIGNVEAVQIAAQNNSQILFDEEAQSPFFHYWKDGIEHEVWFEDVRSIQAKLLTASEYGFLGVGYWNLMRPFRANWLLLDNMMRE